MLLNISATGYGQDLVLIHGFGLDSRIMQEFINKLANNFKVHIVDLPGYGLNRNVNSPATIDALAEMIYKSVPSNALWLGWSLGGMLTTYLACQYSKIKASIALCSNAQFCTDNNWAHAVKSETLAQFMADLKDNYQKTIRRFITLNTLGNTNAKQQNKDLFKSICNSAPSIAALNSGLSILQSTSLISAIATTKAKLNFIFAERDTLVPIVAAKELAVINANINIQVIKDAAHAPFLTNCNELVKNINDINYEYCN